MSNVRLRRLQADFEKLSNYVRKHPRLKIIQSDGEPPERYQLEYRIRSLRQVNEELVEVKSHLVEIALPRNYPRVPPQCRMLSPVFHPNIAPHAICVGDHWSAGEPLPSLVARIGEMLAFQSYNVKSPLNGEAARWVEQHLDELPLDPVSLLVEEPDVGTVKGWRPVTPPPKVAPQNATPVETRPPTRSVPPMKPIPPRQPDPVPAEAQTIAISCPSCAAKYRVTVRPDMRRARCKSCQTVFAISSDDSANNR